MVNSSFFLQTFMGGLVKGQAWSVAYPLLRVEIQEGERERVRGVPPRLLRPASVEPFDLEIDGDLSPSQTAKATHLAKLAPQLTVGALQQRGGADEFACHPIERIVGDGLLKIALKGRLSEFALATRWQRPSNAVSLPGRSLLDRWR